MLRKGCLTHAPHSIQENLAMQDFLALARESLAYPQEKLVCIFSDMNIHQRIKKARTDLKLSMEDLGKLVGVTWQTVQQWEKEDEDGGTAPKRTRLEKVASALGKTSYYLLHGDEEGDFSTIPLVDTKLSAGTGQITFSHDITSYLSFRTGFLQRKGARKEKLIAFPVTGDSMEDKHIIHGSVVLIDRGSQSPRNGHIYGLWIDDQIFVKEMVRLRSGNWVARSHNKAKNYPDIPINLESNGLIGEVIWCGFEI
jgi:phage repressor protein C with HTH and peptisase S24 domain